MVSVPKMGAIAFGGAWAPKNALVGSVTGTDAVSGLIVFMTVGAGQKTDANWSVPQMKWKGTVMTRIGSSYSTTSNGGSQTAFFIPTTSMAGDLTMNTLTDFYVDAATFTYAFVNDHTGIGTPVGKWSDHSANHVTGIVGAKSGSLVLCHAVGIYTPQLDIIASSPTAKLAYSDNTTSNNLSLRISTQEMVANGDASVTWKPPYNETNSITVEFMGGSSTGAQQVKPTGLSNSSAVGTPLVKDPNKSILAPQGIENTSALGAHEFKKTQLVFWSDNTSQHTISNQGVTVTRTDLNADYRISRGSDPIQYGQKRYFEITVDALATAESIVAIGLGIDSISLSTQLGAFNSNAISWDVSGGARDNNTGMNGRPKFGAGDTLMVAVDMTEAHGWVFMGLNGVWYNGTQAGVNFESGDGKVNNTARSTSQGLYPAVQTQNVGDKLTANFGRTPTKYSPPTGYTTLDTIPAARPTQTLTMTGLVADASVLSAIVVKQLNNIRPLGLDNTSALGSPSLVQQVKPTGLANASTTGNPAVVFKVNISGLLGAASVLGDPTVVAGKVILSPSGIAADASSLGSPAIVVGKVTIAPSGQENVSTLGSPALSTAAVKIQPSSIPASFPFMGSPQVRPGSVSVSAPSIENTSSLGAISLKTIVRLTVEGLENTSTVGGLTLQVQQVSVRPAGIWNQEGELGSLVVSSGGVLIVPPGIANDNYLGNPKVNQTVSISGISNDSQLGIPVVAISQRIQAVGIANASSLGSQQVKPGKVTIGTGGVTNTSELGVLFLSQGQFARPDGIENTSQLGTLRLVPKPVQIRPSGLANASVLGSPSIGGTIKVMPTGIQAGAPAMGHPLVWDKRLTHFHKVNGRWVPGTLHARKDGRYRKVIQPLKKAGGNWS